MPTIPTRSTRWYLGPTPLLFLSTAILAGGLGCDAGTRLVQLDRRWFYSTYPGDHAEPVTSEQEQREGVVKDHYDFGELALTPDNVADTARGEVYSSDTGQTYWVSAQAPATQKAGDPLGGEATLHQDQVYKKLIPGASLKVSLTHFFAEGIDSNNDIPPSESQCRQKHDQTFSVCLQEIYGSVWFRLEVTNVSTGIKFLVAAGAAELTGHRANWDYRWDVDNDSTVPLWDVNSFVLKRDFDGDGGRHATVDLARTIEIPIPLDDIDTGGEVKVHVEVSADSANFRQRESYISSFFRDPIQQQGALMTVDGLQLVDPPANLPTEQPPPSPAACPTDADPAAGTIAFADAAPVTPEAQPRRGSAAVLVTRTGGTKGEVSALLTTADGTAQAGADYQPVTTEVRFADGEAGPRTVRIPILNDSVEEPDETVLLTLSRPLGCAGLGAPSQATLTIVDDDAPPTTPTTYDVNGTVTGLAGTGLILRDVATGRMAAPTGTAFSFGRQYVTGESYDVRVDSQPLNPRQSCTVANGTGKIADHDVTNVQITCVTDTAIAGLDPGFGSAGKSTVGHAGAIMALAIQPDGKIVAVGPQMAARYTATGALDPTFGSGGETTIRFRGDTSDQAQGVAVQPDGKIVVVGLSGATNQDFAIARFTAAGQPDPDFGHGAAVATDFVGSTDRAFAVLVQPDGRLVVAGQAADPSPTGTGNDFAVARYTAAGDLDASFGTGGKVMTNIAGSGDVGAAAALQPDGKIVVAGRVAASGGGDTAVGLVRYGPSGALDDIFGLHGVVQATLGSAAQEANGVAIQPDGKIVVSAIGIVGSSFGFVAARFDSGGGADASFGTNGVAGASFGSQNSYARGLALQADGRIVVVGQNPNSGMGDFGVVRFTTGGQPDATFGTDGKLDIDFFGAFDGAQSVAIQPDGGIIVGGSARNGSVGDVGLVRILP